MPPGSLPLSPPPALADLRTRFLNGAGLVEEARKEMEAAEQEVGQAVSAWALSLLPRSELTRIGEEEAQRVGLPAVGPDFVLRLVVRVLSHAVLYDGRSAPGAPESAHQISVADPSALTPRRLRVLQAIPVTGEATLPEITVASGEEDSRAGRERVRQTIQALVQAGLVHRPSRGRHQRTSTPEAPT